MAARNWSAPRPPSFPHGCVFPARASTRWSAADSRPAHARLRLPTTFLAISRSEREGAFSAKLLGSLGERPSCGRLKKISQFWRVWGKAVALPRYQSCQGVNRGTRKSVRLISAPSRHAVEKQPSPVASAIPSARHMSLCAEAPPVANAHRWAASPGPTAQTFRR